MSSQDRNASGEELGDLVEAAHKIAELIEPWFLAVSEHKDVQPIIMEVRSKGDDYYGILDRSLTLSRGEHKLSDDCEKLLEFVEDFPNLGPNEVRDVVSGMKDTAGITHRGVLLVVRLFRDARAGLVVVRESIETRLNREIALASKESSGTLSQDLVQGKGPELISRYNTRDSIVERSASVHSSEDLIDWLQQAANTVKTLDTLVAKYFDWWASLEGHIGAIETELSQINPDLPMKNRWSAGRRLWMEARSAYETYLSQMSLLQDYHLHGHGKLLGPLYRAFNANKASIHTGGTVESVIQSSDKPPVKTGITNTSLDHKDEASVPESPFKPQAQAEFNPGPGISASVKPASTLVPKIESESPPAALGHEPHDIRSSVKPALPRKAPLKQGSPPTKLGDLPTSVSGSVKSAIRGTTPSGVNRSPIPESHGLPDSPGTKLRDFRKSAYKSFVSIEPWKHTASEMKVLIPTVSQLKELGAKFCTALEGSVETSCSGYLMSTGCKDLYLSILSGVSVKDFGLAISGLRRQNQRATSKLAASQKSFRLVSRGFLKATTDVTNVVDGLNDLGVVSRDLKCLTMPSELALLSPIEGGDDIQQSLPTERAREHKNIEEAKYSLRVASAVVLEVDETANQLLDWWKNVDSELNALQTRFKSLDQGSVLKLDVGKQVKVWEDNALQFKNYNLTMDDLQNFLATSAGDSGVSEGE